MTLAEIVSELKGLKGSGAWRRIAAASEVDYYTVSRIMRGVIPNPGVLTCERIARAIKTEKKGVHGAHVSPTPHTV